MKRIIAGVLALSMCGCVSTYTGPKPDFSLTGDAAKKEFEQFQFQKYYWSDAAGFYYMGPEDQDEIYTGNSLEPIINDVSSSAANKERQAKRWMWGYWGALVFAIGYLGSQSDDLDSGDMAVFYGSLLVGVGFGHYSKYLHRQGIDDYNRDLKQKFTPALTYNWQY